ncbi:MAG: dTMP kinase [Candidatus Pacebacteria bacterium]|nr:dTMP kinase [Candidatus Paceibacterota bacterium]
MLKQKGKFIVLEGIDGCGGETQSKKLLEMFKKNGIDFLRIRHPNYSTSLGKIISKKLYSNDDFPEDMQSLLYFTEIYQERNLIAKALEEGKIVFADRYFTATLAYQGMNKKSLSKLIELEKLFPIQKPDVSILIKISTKVSFERKSKEKKGNLDKFEKNLDFLKNVSKNYDKLAKENVFCKWEIADGERSKEEVFEQIVNIINNKLKISIK